MSDPYVGEIRAFGFTYAPQGWALCNGQLLPIAPNTALFSLLGTYYGGDGRTTFALPNLPSRVVMHPGQGPGLSSHGLGEVGGVAEVTLLAQEVPGHSHSVPLAAAGNFRVPVAGRAIAGSADAPAFADGSASTVPLAAGSLTVTGGDAPHNNLMPYLVLNYCIALAGIFPTRS